MLNSRLIPRNQMFRMEFYNIIFLVMITKGSPEGWISLRSSKRNNFLIFVENYEESSLENDPYLSSV